MEPDQPTPRLSRDQIISLQAELEELRESKKTLLALSQHESPIFAIFLIIEVIIIFFYYFATQYPESAYTVGPYSETLKTNTTIVSPAVANHVSQYYPMFQGV